MKHKILLTLSLLSFIIFSSSCQWEHHDTPQPQQPITEYVFTEEFNNDHNQWSFADPANLAYGVVSGGTFKFDYNDNLSDVYYAAKFFGFNPYNDFSIQSRIGSNNSMGILFGYDDQTGAYGYSFMIDYYGDYRLFDEGGNGYGLDPVLLVGPETDPIINPYGDWNDVKIVQRASRWIGYINGVQVFNIEAQNMEGNGVGFIDAAETLGEADYLEVHWYE